MTHDQVVAEIQARAKQRGVYSHYCKRAERCEGDPGIPDVVLLGPDGTDAWIEVKTPGCPTLSSGQVRWKYRLRAGGHIHEVMGERDLAAGGAVDMILSFVATGEVRGGERVKILIWSVDPRVRTAYGSQCGMLALELRKLGHKVTIGAIGAKLKDQGHPWNGIPVRFVGGRGTHGSDVLAAEAARCKADLVLLLLDSFMVDARVVGALDCRVAYWCPVDAVDPGGGLPVLYKGMLQLAPRAVPIAMSRWAERMFRRDGFEPLYVPHMIDTDVFRPMPERRAGLRAACGIPPDAFVITMVAANSERFRKNFPGQFDAFRRAAQPGWRLLVHSYPLPDQDGWDLPDLAQRFGIADQVMFADPDRIKAGAYTAAGLAAWYNLADLHTQCTLAEGFGIPSVEAQACGLPVVATDGSAMSELVGAGWTIPGEQIMNPGQRAEWVVPYREQIADAYRDAAGITLPGLGQRARAFAEGFSVETVMAEYWKPALEALEAK